MYKVFTDDTLIIFKANTNAKEPLDIESIRKKIDTKESKIIVESKTPEKALEEVFSNYTQIHAAGGLVINQHSEFLLIHRLGKWDLPKGKAEPGESIETTAIREVEEECGISEIQLHERITKTYHSYRQKDQNILKISHWYRMSYNGDETPVPQTQENIEKALWYPWSKRKSIYKNTYGTIIDVLEKALIQ